MLSAARRLMLHDRRRIVFVTRLHLLGPRIELPGKLQQALDHLLVHDPGGNVPALPSAIAIVGRIVHRRRSLEPFVLLYHFEQQRVDYRKLGIFDPLAQPGNLWPAAKAARQTLNDAD